MVEAHPLPDIPGLRSGQTPADTTAFGSCYSIKRTTSAQWTLFGKRSFANGLSYLDEIVKTIGMLGIPAEAELRAMKMISRFKER